MPMGFMAILGGTVTMVGSSPPLILLNDLMLQGDLEPFGIFAVTPIGLVLLLTGILYFLLLGRHILPSGDGKGITPPGATGDHRDLATPGEHAPLYCSQKKPPPRRHNQRR